MLGTWERLQVAFSSGRLFTSRTNYTRCCRLLKMEYRGRQLSVLNLFCEFLPIRFIESNMTQAAQCTCR